MSGVGPTGHPTTGRPVWCRGSGRARRGCALPRDLPPQPPSSVAIVCPTKCRSKEAQRQGVEKRDAGKGRAVTPCRTTLFSRASTRMFRLTRLDRLQQQPVSREARHDVPMCDQTRLSASRPPIPGTSGEMLDSHNLQDVLDSPTGWDRTKGSDNDRRTKGSIMAVSDSDNPVTRARRKVLSAGHGRVSGRCRRPRTVSSRSASLRIFRMVAAMQV
jgi:hypothetical protein